MRRKKKSIAKSALGLTGSAVTMSAGGSVLGATEGPIAAQGAAGVSRMAGYMPMMGTIAGAGHALGELKGVSTMARKRKRKKRK